MARVGKCRSKASPKLWILCANFDVGVVPKTRGPPCSGNPNPKPYRDRTLGCIGSDPYFFGEATL